MSLLRDDDADIHQVAVFTLTTLVMKADNIDKTLEAGASDFRKGGECGPMENLTWDIPRHRQYT